MLLPLDTWRSILGANPWHFFQFADDSIVPLTSSCSDLVYKYDWQGTGAAGREGIIRAIEQAETRLIDFLSYSPAPHFITEEHRFPVYPDVRFDQLGYAGADGRWRGLQLKEGYIQKIGVEKRDLISAVNLTYSDEDGDGLDETWTATANVTFTDITQVACYVPAADRLDGDAVSEEYRILPIKVTISGGVATITGKAWLMALPVLYEGAAVAPLDPTDSTNFLTTIEVYHLYCDPTGTTYDTSQAKLIWETRPHPYWCYCGVCNSSTNPANSYDPAAEGYAMARVSLRDPQAGLAGIGEAQYNSTSGQYYSVNWLQCRPPDRVVVRYQAGVPLETNGQMSKRWQQIVAYFAAAELAAPICACQDANRVLYHWQFDLARTGGADGESYGAVSQDMINCKFGTRRGAYYAWQQVGNLFQGRGFAVGD